MLSKAFLVYGIMPWVFLLAAEDSDIESTNCTAFEIKTRYTILTKMSTYTQGLWNITPPEHNIQFFPLMDVMNKNIDLFEVYYEDLNARMQHHAKFLKEPLELAKVLKVMQKARHVNLTLKTAIFAATGKVNHAYLQEAQSYYHTEPHTRRYDPNDKVSIQNNARKWITDNTRDRKFNSEDPWLPKPADVILTNVLKYKACWYYPMVTDGLSFVSYRRAKFPTSCDVDVYHYVNSVRQKQVLKYFNNTEGGYEAISIPYRGNKFALAVVMPHAGHHLDMFVNFTAEDYSYMLGHIRQASNRAEELVHYNIPVLNIPMVSITENGTSINQNDPEYCGPALLWSDDSPHIREPLHKVKFFVERPYGLMLYHERTMFVLWHAWIRNPSSDVYVSRRINFTDPEDAKLNSKVIF